MATQSEKINKLDKEVAVITLRSKVEISRKGIVDCWYFSFFKFNYFT